MIITTAGRTNEEMVKKAKQVAVELGGKYIDRNKHSISTIIKREQNECLVVGKERLELYPLGENEPFFFHPNSSMFRVKRIAKGEKDPFAESVKLETGMSFLDCTLGLASDSIVASYIVRSSGKIIGVEANPYLAYIVGTGLKEWSSGNKLMDEAMKNITVIQSNSLEVMLKLDDNSIDCVYFDPMFEESILESDGIRGLAHFAKGEGLSEEMMTQALRVAKRRVVLKDYYRSLRFREFGFKVNKRKTAKFHFGVIEKT